MALVELRDVEWLDTPTATTTVSSMFVRCTRHADAALKKPLLRLQLLCGPRMWRAEVLEKHKPAVLDCSSSEFLQALETAFTPAGGGDSRKPRFSYKWAAQKAQLTLSEHAGSGLAMKYASVSFTAVDEDEQSWQHLLHDVVAQSERSLAETTRQRQRIRELEEMIAKKDTLLETALTAKQRLEDELFAKFCAVLNGKKEELERLQREVALASASASSKTAYKPKASVKKRAPLSGKKKTMGAKLTKKATKKKKANEYVESEEEEEDDDDEGEEEEEEESGSDDGSESEHSTAEHEDDDSPKKPRSRSRAKRDAINAYSQLASQIPMTSQVCAAADVLDDLDEIMKTDVERDDEQATSTRLTKKRPPPPAAKRPQSPEKKIKTAAESTPPSTSTRNEPAKTKPKVKAASPPRKPVDSEEEDILDMLS